jgi:wyosine [tRNA(Phe)-imidazoG37] synthetase (radical SAM superfamily)
MNTISSTFCVLPWFSKEITEKSLETPCCLLSDNFNLKQIQFDLLNDIQSTACQKCWDIEQQGNDSRRIQENRFLDYKLDRDIEKIEQDCKDGNSKILMQQITLSNLCNQACVTCGPALSTKWRSLVSNKTIPIVKLNLTNNRIDYKDVKRLYILGGEPLYDPLLFDILQLLIDHNNTNCFISFVTNGSVFLSKRQLNMLAQFDNINICISVDGIESRFEYMRWPGKWNRLLENIEQYKEITNNNISISYTVSSVNAIYYDETISWFLKNNLRYNHNIVSKPSWASLSRAPTPIKEKLQKNNFFKSWTDTSGNEIPMSLFFDELQKQDELKHIALKEYMPELYSIIVNNLKI